MIVKSSSIDIRRENLILFAASVVVVEINNELLDDYSLGKVVDVIEKAILQRG